jgi:hypothetical protein
MTNEQRIRELVDRGCSGRIESEQALRDFVIGGGLIEAMGWSFDRAEWQVNVPVYFGSQVHHMDYLVGSGTSKFIVEAKAPSQRLDKEEFVGELISYMLQSGTPYGILYNGKSLLAFKEGSEIPFYEWNCGSNLDIFRMFSAGAFPNQLENFIRSQGETTKFRTYVSENTNKIKAEIIGLMSRLSAVSKEVVERLFPFILNQLGERGDKPEPPSDTEATNSLIRRSAINLPEGEVVICASTSENQPESGINWLKKYNAWRAVRISGNPKYLALYLSAPISKVLYFAEVEQIRDVMDPDLIRMGLPEPDPHDLGKKAVLLKPNSIKELEDPILIGEKRHGIRDIMYLNSSVLTHSYLFY